MSFKWFPYYIHYGNASLRHIVTILKIWHTLCNLIPIAQLEKRENIQGSMLLLLKLLKTLLKVALVHGCCFCFFLTIGKSFRPKISNVIEQLKNFQIIQKMSNLRIWSHLLKKSLTENFIFCVVWLWDFSLFSISFW